MLAAADSPPQLMHLSQTKSLGVFDQHHAGVRNIDTDLEHGGADQRVRGAAPKTFHDLLFVWRWNSAVNQFAAKRMQTLLPYFVLRCCRFHIQFFTFIDQRINHVELASPFQLTSQERKDLR